MKTGERFVFVVDTGTFSGGFERELCGYLTGRHDEPVTHGDVEAEIAWRELTPEAKEYFDRHVILCPEQPDDLPELRPGIPYPTPGWWNDGRGNYAKGVPSAEQLKGCFEGKPWPAYFSVGIFFDERPPDEMIGILKTRALAFAKDYWPNHRSFGHPLEVTGFRVLEEFTQTVEERV